jgi:hypothetical protein
VAHSKTLGKYLAPKEQQRLSLDEVDQQWNIELHREAGRVPYKPKTPVETREEGPINWQQVGSVLMDFQNIFKWQDAEGKVYDNDEIALDLIGLIEKGDLRAFPSKDTNVSAMPVDGLPEVNLRENTTRYFIDRDELGCFLVARGHPLPRFWYEGEDVNIYENRLAAQAESLVAQREHLKAVVTENESLKQQLLNARPFMNPGHPHFAPELEAAVQLWHELFSEQPADVSVAKKPAMASWLRANRPDAIVTPDGKPSESAIERITTFANPRKEGGRPRKSRFS